MIDAKHANPTAITADQAQKLLALLDWYRAVGVDDAVDDVAVNWRLRGDVPPPSARQFTAQALPAAALTNPTGANATTRTASASDGAAAPSTSTARHASPRYRSDSGSGPGSDFGASPTNASPPPPSKRDTASAFATDGRSNPPGAAPARPASQASVADARATAAQAETLEALHAALAEFDGCSLKTTAKSLCFYRGAKQARLMVIGEAPGRDEDREGRPFVGRAGQLLDKMLAAIGLSEEDVHITNTVYWRPPGNRTPTPIEVHACRPFLERQIALVAPEFILSVGGPAAKSLLDTPVGIMKLRGKWRDITVGGHATRLMPTLHPAYLLRTPAAKRLAWRDLLAVRALLDDPTGAGSPSEAPASGTPSSTNA